MPEAVNPTPRTSQALTQPAHAVLDNLQIVRVSGPSARQFLHGQLTQSLDEATDTHSPRAAACNPKGRAYLLTRLVRHNEDFLLALPRSLAEATITHLKKYLMLFRGTTMNIVDDAQVIGLIGHHALVGEGGVALDKPGATRMVDNHRLIRTQDTADGTPRFELWRLGPLSSELDSALRSSCHASDADWQATEIASGVASLTPDTQDTYIPQMLNWQHVDGIHFKKGCYTGQEVIARMHFLGQLKKSLFRLHTAELQTTPIPGQAILAGDHPVGHIVNVAMLNDGTAELLAVLRHDATDKTLLLDTVPPVEVTLENLPYTVIERQKSAPKDT
ncbi:MAG: folate-binding protein [Marinobacter sp.]|uniref:CAF17-like 4Fe-4S cluster assembly/insertion protein YgfZ n=1 Tax=Marinobacter sp. TaxID=50741 RepID=UPI0034A07845